MRPRLALALLAASASIPLAGCNDVETRPACTSSDPSCACAEARRLPSGACCPSWTTALESTGECIRRPFSLPNAADALGDPGARLVSAAIDGSKRGLVAWEVAPTSASSSITVAEESALGAWSLRAPGAALKNDGGGVTAAAGQDGHAIVTWRQGPSDATGVFRSERSPEGVWTDPKGMDDRISWIEETATRPHVVIGASGEALIVWDQWIGDNYGVQVARRLSAYDPWEMPETPTEVLSPLVLYSNEPRVSLNRSGDAVIAWFQSAGGALMTYMSERFGASGEFSHPGVSDFISIDGAPVDQHLVANPRTAVSDGGEAAVAWTQENGQGAIVVFLATRDAAGTWAFPADLNDSFSPAENTAKCVIPVFGPRGDLYVTWFQDLGAGTEVLLAHRGPSGDWLTRGDAPKVLSTPGATALTPAIAVSDDGAVLVAWSEEVSGQFRVAARRGGSGDEPWGPIEVLSPEGDGDAFNTAVAVGPDDRALVAWTQGAPLDERVFVARVE